MTQHKSVLNMDKISATIAKEGQVIGNLVAAIDVLEAAPSNHVNLSSYVCGTNACVAGWLATEPFFTDQDERLSYGCSQEYKAVLIAENRDMWSHKRSNVWGKLFNTFGSGEYDEELKTQHGKMSHKQLGLARLHHHLKILRAKNIE